jgi:hypothetical protein
VTSVLPSVRFVTPSLAAATPGPAFALPPVVSGGQTLAHAPSQLLIAPLSFSKRYRVRPRASTTIRPSFVRRVLTVPTAGVGVARVAPYADPLLSPPDVEPPPAATTAAITATAARGRITASSRLMSMGGLLACVVDVGTSELVYDEQ